MSSSDSSKLVDRGCDSNAHSSAEYHHPAVLSLPQTFTPTPQLDLATTTALVDSLLTLYDSNYTTHQLDTALPSDTFHPAIRMSCAACAVHSLADMRAVYCKQRRAFSRYVPRVCWVTVGGGRVVLDMEMEWVGLDGRVVRRIGTMLKARVVDGKVVELEEVWSLNDRLGKWLTFGQWNLFDGLRWLVS